MSTANPYASPGVEKAEAVSSKPRPGKVVSWRMIFIGLLLMGAAYGISFALSMSIFGRVAMYSAGWSPVGNLPISELIKAAMAFSGIGSLGGLLAIPLLLVFNRRGRLHFISAFGCIAAIGTGVFVLIACLDDSNRGLAPLSPVATRWVTFACLIWLPTLVAAATFGFWIKLCRAQALPEPGSISMIA